MKYLPLVWSALWRKPAECLLTFFAITAAFTLLTVMIGVNLTVRQIVERAPMDRLWVTSRFHNLAPPFNFPLALGAQLARIDGVVAVAASHGFSGYHVDPHDTVGVEFVDDGMRTVWSEGPITPVLWNQLSAMPLGIIVSAKAAAKWHLAKDDSFTIITEPGSRLDGGNSWEFHVLGIVPEDWNRSGPEGFILGNLQYFENAAPLDVRNWGYGYEVAITDGSRAMQISSEIDQKFANSGMSTMTIPKRVNEQTYVNRGVSTAALTFAIAGAGLAMILLLIGNATARSVRERVPEFAILQTIGFHHVHLVYLVFLEAVIPCILGAAVSTAFAGALEQWSRHFLPQVLVTFLTAPMPRLLVLVWTFGLALLLAAASSVIPLLKLRHQSVPDALAAR
ncbi:MAG TPA: ABC transporter permease [Steroidobacteraceae bacterium]|jgi:putative ABC transport system permease protein|nr:ABC transporter permease [Steroidobacteraceae bacterium]